MRTSVLATALSMLLGGAALAAPNSPSATPQGPKPAQPTQAAPPSAQSSTRMRGAQPVDVFFQTDSVQLNANADASLQQLASWARCNPTASIVLEGHADPRGGQPYNIQLSGQRAAVVRQRLIQLGVPSDHIVVVVYGENGTKGETYAARRRVTVRALQRPIDATDLSG
jgi:peptidoglycan-associated lipoprotein